MNNMNDDNGIDFIRKRPPAIMAIHFWEVDDRNGRLAMDKLIQLDDNDNTNDIHQSHGIGFYSSLVDQSTEQVRKQHPVFQN